MGPQPITSKIQFEPGRSIQIWSARWITRGVRRGGIFVLLLSALTACEGSDSQSPQLVQRLQREFKETLGIDLHVGRFSDPRTVALEPSVDAEHRFGEFRVLVLDSSHDAKLILDASRDLTKRADAHGVYWTEIENERSRNPTPSWSAAKRYGRVLLRWWNVAPQENRNWRRLDAAVRNAVGQEA